MTKDEVREQFEKLVVETYGDDKYYIQPKGDKGQFLELFRKKIDEARFIKIRNSLVATRSIKAVYYEYSKINDVRKINNMTLTSKEIEDLKELGVIRSSEKGERLLISGDNKQTIINYLTDGKNLLA